MDNTASPPSPPNPSSPPSAYQTHHDFASTFTNLYHSIFPPLPSPLPSSLSLTPSSSPPSSAATTNTSTDDCLRQARLILEYHELCDHYEMSVARFQALTNELHSLRQENADLRAANLELLRILSLSSQAASIQNIFMSNSNVAISNESNRLERRNAERVTLPKSISVRSIGYLKANQASAINGGTPSFTTSTSGRPTLGSQLNQLVSGSGQQRVLLAAGGGAGKRCDDVAAAAVEFEVYNQGMWKTELCNKWQESGTCPYGGHCQFAHGITELRPVVRHPRYKTQACRMVLSGDVCPYGHRCHFRHSLTEQERLLLGPR